MSIKDLNVSPLFKHYLVKTEPTVFEKHYTVYCATCRRTNKYATYTFRVQTTNNHNQAGTLLQKFTSALGKVTPFHLGITMSVAEHTP